METLKTRSDPKRGERAFNFLASLINGNFGGSDPCIEPGPFNFLASLINGNPRVLPVRGCTI